MADTNPTAPVVNQPADQSQGQDPKQSQGQDTKQSQSGQPGQLTGQADPSLAQGGSQAIRKMKLKVDGKDLELDEPEVIRRAQMGTAAYQRMQEAAKARQQAEEFIGKLRKDPFEVIDDPRLGLTDEQKIKMVEDWYRRKVVEPSTLTPEQLKAKQQEAELNKYRDAEKAQKQKEEQQRMQLLEEHHLNGYKQMIRQGLESENLPKNEFCAKRMATLLAKNIQLGLDLTPQQLATLVREDYVEEIRAVLGNSDGEVLLKLMGDDVANKLRKADLARIRGGNFQPSAAQSSVKAPQSQSEHVKKFMRLDDKLEEIKKKFN